MTQATLPVIPKERSGLRLLRSVKQDPLGYFTKLMSRAGAYVWLNLNGQPLLMLNDAAGIQHVLQDNASNYTKAHFNKVLRPLLGNGIFLSEGQRWRKQRQESAPVFANGNFEEMTAQMVSATEAMLKRWEPRVACGEPIDITVEMMQLTLDILLRALFHETKDDIATDMQKELGKLLREAEGRIWSAFNLPQSFVLAMPKYRRAMDFLQKIVHGMIAARLANRDYPDDLLSRLVSSYELSPEEQKCLRDQVMSFLLAGHETTAHGLAWTFYNISRYPSVKEKFLIEVSETLEGRSPTVEDVKKMTYTRQVFDEALRLYPPVWTMSRQNIKDDSIPLDDGSRISLPKNSVVMLCGYAVQRRQKYWEDPEAFYPERFNPEKSVGRPKFAWFPFGGGPRLCLGFRFAQIESIVATTMIAQKYDFCLMPGQHVEPEPIITLRPSAPILFQFKEKRKSHAEGLVELIKLSDVGAEAVCPYVPSVRAQNE